MACNMLSAISATGQIRFMVTRGRVNAAVFIEFLKRLLCGAQRKIFLIVDGHPTHRARKTKQFVASTEGKLELFFLPPYSPELNPDEHVWNHVKNHRVGRKVITNRDDLEREVRASLRSLLRTPEKVRSFFQSRTTSYAV
jgi:transposase